MHNHITERLAEFDDVWNAAQVSFDLSDNLPDGKYEARLSDIGFKESKKGRLQCVMEWEVQNRPYQGKKLWKYCGLATPDNVAFFKADCKRLGIDVNTSLLKLENAFSTIRGQFYEINLKQNGQYQNIYINKPLGNDHHDAYDDDIQF